MGISVVTTGREAEEKTQAPLLLRRSHREEFVEQRLAQARRPASRPSKEMSIAKVTISGHLDAAADQHVPGEESTCGGRVLPQAEGPVGDLLW